MGAEAAGLAVCALVARAGGRGKNDFGRPVDRRTIGLDRVKRARRGEALELPPVELTRVDPRGEILEVFEWTAMLALLDQRLHRFRAAPLESAARAAPPVSIWPVLDRE